MRTRKLPFCLARAAWVWQFCGALPQGRRSCLAADAYLLGSDAGFVTGTALLIDGGTIAALKSGLFDLRVR